MSETAAGSGRTATLVLLSLDERDALEVLLPRLPLRLFDRVLAIDGGSTDGTRELYAERSITVRVQPPDRKGRGNAFLIARDEAKTDDIVFLSADGNEDPEDLPRILALLRQGADMVIGGRFVLRGSRTDTSDDPLRLRKAGAISFGLLARFVFGSRVWDATNGYRGFRLESMRRMALDAPGHEIEYQATIRATKLGLRVHEIPSKELDRAGGRRKASAGTWRLGWCTLRCLLREIAIGRRFEPRA